MKKIVISSPGGYEKLVVTELPDPTPKNDEVLIQVKGVGINYADILIRLGVYASAKHYVGWPITPGFEVSGQVIGIGPLVKKYKVGDQVMGFTRFDGYSSLICIKEDHVMSLPQGFDLLQSAGFPAVYMTAYYALKQIFTLRPKSKILVHSAAGGVGSALVQLAKADGHFVVGVVGAANKVEYVKKLGADIVIDKSTDPNFWSTLQSQGLFKKFDVAYDPNGFTTIAKSYEFLNTMGKLVVYGSHSLIPKKGGKLNWIKLVIGYLKTKRFNPLDLVTDNKSLIGFNVSYLFEQNDMLKENLEGLYSYCSRGLVYPPETTYIPFSNVAEAHKLLESGTTRGKLVLTL